MISSSELLRNAMQLPESERAELVRQLILTLEPDWLNEQEFGAAWQKEIDSRLHKIADGSHQTHDWREAIREIRQELKEDVKS